MYIPQRTFTSQRALLAVLAAIVAQTAGAQTPGYAVLHSFQGGADGAEPQGGVILGKDGSLYGTTFGGGAGSPSECNINKPYHCGTVFKLTPVAAGSWANTVIFDFDGPDGGAPGSSLAFGEHGALYGTTEAGGSGDQCGGTGDPGGGTVFQLLPPATAGGAWTENLLYSFPCHLGNPRTPKAGVLIGPGGALFGTTFESDYRGGVTGFESGGSVFMESPPATPGGAWAESIVLDFADSSLGSFLYAGVISARGSLYGVTTGTTGSGCGLVYELSPPASAGAAWTGSAIYSFGGPPGDGCTPFGTLSVGPGGEFYGTTWIGGTATPCAVSPYLISGCGTVFKLTAPATVGGPWTETVIYNFTGVDGDGVGPQARLVIGKNGAIYGTTTAGGSAASNCICGTVFKLMPPATTGGAWTETILHSFTDEDGDGSDPGPLTLSPNGGILYGTTSGGGTAGFGTIYAITLSGGDAPTQ